MDLFPDADQQAVIDTVSDLCRRRFPMKTVRAQAKGQRSIEDDDWRALADLGCFTLGLPADLGGAESGVVGELLVIRELARYLVPGPVMPTILAVHALSRSHPEIAGQIAEGTTRVALAEPIARSDDRPERYLVGDLDDGPVLVVDDERYSVYPAGACTNVDAVRALDPSTRLATAEIGDGEPLVELRSPALRSRGQVLVAAAMCGVAAATTDLSAEYAKQRQQFGQPIGSFQAVKHRCAEMAVRTEAAYSQTIYAGLVLDQSGADTEFQVAAARLIASTAAGDNCADNIQNHGGIGFTEECDAHLYLRRWRALDRTLGDRFSAADRLASLQAAQ